MAELALKLSLQGMQGVRAGDLPAAVSFDLDIRGPSLVQVHAADREVALLVMRTCGKACGRLDGMWWV